MRTRSKRGQRDRAGALISAVEAVFRPLAQVLVEHGVSSPEAESLFRAVCVHEVARLQAIRAKSANASRVALVTGLDRKQVAKILKHPPRVDPALETRCRAKKVLAGWYGDRSFARNAKPLELPIKTTERKRRPSFWMLARRYAPDFYPGLILRELSRVGAVEKLKDGRVRVRMRHFTARSLTEQTLREVRSQVEHFLSAHQRPG
jgi:Family of unknown function (DUF6502)